MSTPQRARGTSTLAIAVGVLMVLIGLLWFGQGIGLIGGSFMTGSATWAVIGPVVAIVGVLLVLRGTRKI
jgi:hypothetical protein